MSEYHTENIEKVKQAIKCTSYSFGQTPITIEDKTVKDADMLEATGAVAIMRTFTYGARMNRPFYNPQDPFCEVRQPDDMKYSVDLFYTRLLKIEDVLSTETAKNIAYARTKFLRIFLEQLKLEIS